MKHTLFCRATAVLSTGALLFGGMLSASALQFEIGGQYTDMGTIVTSSSEQIADGVEYAKTTYTDKNSYGQTMYSLEFNPTEGEYIPLMYQAKPSFGIEVKDSVAAAEAEGYEVIGAVNGEFGSANPENWGTLDSRLITNGEIVADSEYKDVMCLAFNSDGSYKLVKSRIAYHFYVEGKEILNAESGDPVIGSINKRYVGTNWWSPFCYFDYKTGGATYTHDAVPGVEVVFEKLNGTELTVEGVLEGRVVSIHTDAYATPMTENQFVLYAQNGSANYQALADLKVGQTCQIYAEELNADAKEVMKNASSVTGATYPIVVDGVDNTPYTPNAGDIYATRAQRTAIGMKADGTMMLIVVDGRGDTPTYNKGITLPELADLMISLGCVHAVNLDGGGSSTMYTDGENKITYDRGVSSSLLICKRNSATASADAKEALTALKAEATSASYPSTQQTLVDLAIQKAEAVLNDKTAMTNDFLRARMDLLAAMGKTTAVTPKDYISLNVKDWTYNTSIMQATNDESGALVLNNTNNQWPSASFSCEMNVPADARLYFDLTVNGSTSVRLTVDGEEFILNKLIAPDSLDANGDDIVGNGKTFKGFIPVSAIKEGGFELTKVMLFAVGSAGAGSKITVREFDIRNTLNPGDVNDDGAINSRDVRLLLRNAIGKADLTDKQVAAADFNGNGQVDTDDARLLLQTYLGLL